MKLMFIIALCASLAPGAEVVRELSTQIVVHGGDRAAEFRHGYVVAFWPSDRVPATYISVFAPGGKRFYETNIPLVNGGPGGVHDIDFDADGNAVAAVRQLGPWSCEGGRGLMILDTAGRQTGFIDTGCYQVEKVTVAPDHTIWTLGHELGGTPGKPPSTDYMAVRHFDFDGKQSAAAIPVSSLSNWWAASDIQATPDRVGILACTGTTCSHPEWIELDQNGKTLERLRINNIFGNVSVAFTANDKVYAQGFVEDGGRGPLFRLDRSSHSMREVAKLEKPDSSFPRGTDGSSLVYFTTRARQLVVQWLPQP